MPDAVASSHVREMIRAVLSTPERARSVLGLDEQAPGSSRAERNGDQALLRACWQASKTRDGAQLRAIKSDLLDGALELDPVSKLMIDDYALSLAHRIDPAFESLLLADAPIPKNLPLLDSVMRRAVPKPSLKGTVLLACQHLLGSTATQFAYLHRLGVEWQDMYIVGKPYSTSRIAMMWLQQQGAHVHPFSLEFPSEAARNASWFESALASAVSDLVVGIRERLGEEPDEAGKVLVMDDGGMVIDTLDSKRGIEPHHVVAVEQTTGGMNRIAQRKLAFPVVDVAGSTSKLTLEAEQIADSIVKEMAVRIRRIRGRCDLAAERILLIGFGPVGAWVATALGRAGARALTIYDNENRKLAIARASGYRIALSLRRAIKSSTLIIGCTGERAFPQAYDREIAADTILFSGSSGNFEFNGLVASRVRDRLMTIEKFPFRGVTRSSFSRVHDDYRSSARKAQGRFWVANAGFPVNFTGGLDPIPTRDIQITRTLMIAGAIQAKSLVGAAGPHHFSPEYDRCIADAYEQILTSRGEATNARRSPETRRRSEAQPLEV
jgi:S-adenosylhomocysteine hydrolase